MKVICFLGLLSLTSCFSPEFKVGECIQKPDESTVWKIESFKDGIAQLKLHTRKDISKSKEATLPGGYIKTRCRK